MRRIVATFALASTLALGVGSVAAATPHQVTLWTTLCENAGGSVVSGQPVLDCINFERASRWSSGFLTALETLCERRIGGTFEYRAVTSEVAICSE